MRKITPIGVEIKKRLLDKNMTQVELAKKVGTSTSYLTNIIHGGKQPLIRSHILNKILLELEIETNDFQRNINKYKEDDNL